MKLSIVIPCYNEVETIAEIVRKVKAAPVKSKEIVIVDDCSTDGTRELIRNEIEPNVDKVIYHDHNHRRYRGGTGRRPRIQSQGIPRAYETNCRGQRGCCVRVSLYGW